MSAEAKYHLPADLAPFGKRELCQNDEDGIIAKIFECIPPLSRYFVEFGIGPSYWVPDYSQGIEGNTVLLRKQGWNGLLMDGNVHPPEFDIKQEFVEPMNINRLLRKYDVPKNCDLISIDIDGQDFWIWMAIDLSPTLFIVEYNPNLEGVDTSLSVPYDPEFRWDLTTWYGASLGALVKCGLNKGYTMVYANGVNIFFVRTDRLSNPNEFDPAKLGRWHKQHIPDPQNRPFVKI